MGLLSSFFSRATPATDAAPEADASDSVARARSRARQRLLGAVVLVGAGIIGFPLLFETQPRPIPVDVPIEIPAREGATPLKQPGQRSPASVGQSPAQPTTVITETAAEAGLATDKTSAAATTRTAERSAAGATEKSASPVVDRDRASEKASAKADDALPTTPMASTRESRADAKGTSTSADRDEAARARALLEGKVVASQEAPSTGGRYIVQIGAFADPALARATRLKVERLGLVTYTHVARTPQGERTRVRVGPVASREEAEKLAARIKAAGLPSAILTL